MAKLINKKTRLTTQTGFEKYVLITAHTILSSLEGKIENDGDVMLLVSLLCFGIRYLVLGTWYQVLGTFYLSTSV